MWTIAEAYARSRGFEFESGCELNFRNGRSWIGFGVMAGMTAVTLAVNPVCNGIPDCSRPSFPMMVWAVGMTGAMGTGIGAGIDTMIGRNRPVIYRRGWPRASPQRLAPALVVASSR